MNLDTEKILTDLMPMITQWGIKIIGALVAFVVAWLVAGWVQKAAIKGFARAELDATLSKFGATVIRWLILVAAIIAILGIFGVETTSFAAILGAAGLAVGLAFQGSLGNVASGVMLLIFRPFKVGDVVRTGGETGKVDEIGLFSTTLDTPDNRRILIPNSAVAGGAIENLTFHPARRVDVAVGTDYTADLDLTRAVLEGAIDDVEDQYDGLKPAAYLVELGDSAITWSVRVWTAQANFPAVKEQLTVAVKKHLDKAGIGIPFPQMDVHHDALK